jgi:hypothetical protein
MNSYERIYNVVLEAAEERKDEALDPELHAKIVGKKGLERERIQRSDRPEGWQSKLQKKQTLLTKPPKGDFGVTKDETEEDVTRQRVARRGEMRSRALASHESGKLTAAGLKSRIKRIGLGQHDWPRHSTDPQRRPQGVPVQRPRKF